MSKNALLTSFALAVIFSNITNAFAPSRIARYGLLKTPAVRRVTIIASTPMPDEDEAKVVGEMVSSERRSWNPIESLKKGMTKKNLAAAGMSVFLSYGFISNINR